MWRIMSKKPRRCRSGIGSTPSAFRSIRRSATTTIAIIGAPPCAASADRLDMLAVIYRKPVVVGEIGLRSAAGAAAKPWESAEERAAAADPALQADVLADWLTVLDRPTIGGVLIWRWFTDPNAGGLSRHRFHRAGQAGRTRSAMRVDASAAATAEQGTILWLELVPDAEDQSILLQRIAAGIGRIPAALQLPGRGRANRPR